MNDTDPVNDLKPLASKAKLVFLDREGNEVDRKPVPVAVYEDDRKVVR